MNKVQEKKISWSRRVLRYQTGNQNPYIEEEQKTQRPYITKTYPVSTI